MSRSKQIFPDWPRLERRGADDRSSLMPVRPSDVGELVALSRIIRVGRVALTIAVVAASAAVAFALAAASPPVAVRWGTGAVLLVLLVATGVAVCARRRPRLVRAPAGLGPGGGVGAHRLQPFRRRPAGGWWRLTRDRLCGRGGVGRHRPAPTAAGRVGSSCRRCGAPPAWP